MPINSNLQFEQASVYSDLGSLDAIRQQGLNDEKGALKKAAKEFEAFFMGMMLKSMRQASEVIGENSLTGSEEEKMFTGMMDEQLSVNLSQEGHLGIAELMMSQLTPQNFSSSKRFQNKESTNNSSEKIGLEKPGTTQVDGNQLGKYRAQPIRNDKATSIETTSINQTLQNEVDKFQKETRDITAIINSNVLDPIKKQSIETVKTSIVIKTEKVEAIKPEKKSLFDEVSQFVSTLLPLAKNAAEKLSLDPRILIAQAALETGWGKFIMHDDSGEPGFNLFGIKAGSSWTGDSIKIDTLEVEQQEFKKVNASFRKYQGFNQSFDDYVNFIKQNPRYSKAVQAADNVKNYVEQLQQSGYATDPNYANKIMRIFKNDVLQNIDLDVD